MGILQTHSKSPWNVLVPSSRRPVYKFILNPTFFYVGWGCYKLPHLNPSRPWQGPSPTVRKTSPMDGSGRDLTNRTKLNVSFTYIKRIKK